MKAYCNSYSHPKNSTWSPLAMKDILPTDISTNEPILKLHNIT